MKVALIGLAPLHALGLEALIGQLWPDASVVKASDREEDYWQQSDTFIVSASAIAAYAPFFMPRLSQVLLITSSPALSGQILPSVSPLGSEAELTLALRRLFEEQRVPQHHPVVHTEMSTPPLTAREMEVLRLTVKGFAAKEIAAELEISVNTVLTHRKKITDKLGVHGAPALVYYAMTHKLV